MVNFDFTCFMCFVHGCMVLCINIPCPLFDHLNCYTYFIKDIYNIINRSSDPVLPLLSVLLHSLNKLSLFSVAVHCHKTFAIVILLWFSISSAWNYCCFVHIKRTTALQEKDHFRTELHLLRNGKDYCG